MRAPGSSGEANKQATRNGVRPEAREKGKGEGRSKVIIKALVGEGKQEEKGE